MGTITLEVTEPAPKPEVTEKKEKEPTFLDALSGGWEVFTTVVRYLTVAVGALLPFALTAALVVALVRLYRRMASGAPEGDCGPGPAADRGPGPRTPDSRLRTPRPTCRTERAFARSVFTIR